MKTRINLELVRSARTDPDGDGVIEQKVIKHVENFGNGEIDADAPLEAIREMVLEDDELRKIVKDNGGMAGIEVRVSRPFRG